MPNKCDPAAERAVVAGVFAFGQDAYLDIADIVTSQTFTIDSNEVLYRCLEHLVKDNAEAKPDLASVLSAANTLGLHRHFEDKSEVKHLRGVMNMAATMQPTSVLKLAAKIRKLEVARLLDQQLEGVQTSLEEITGDEPIMHILGLAENAIFDFSSLINDNLSRGTVPMGEGAEEFIVHLMENPRETVGISTGMRHFDKVIGGGLRDECFDIIGARQKTGKTMVVDNVGIHVARQGIPVLNIDKEMSHQQHLVRVAANMSHLEINLVEQGKYGRDAAKRQKLILAMRELKTLPYDYLCAVGMEFEDELAFMRRWIKRRVGLDENTGKARPCVILYDWLKLNSSSSLTKNMQEYQMLGFICSGLKNFMGRYGARCLCFCQLNREGIDTEDTSVIRGSDRILDFCTSFSIYKKKDVTEQVDEVGSEVRYTHKLINLLSRFGPGHTPGEYINVQAVYSQGRIIEGPASGDILKEQKQPRGEIVVDADPDDEGFAFTRQDSGSGETAA